MRRKKTAPPLPPPPPPQAAEAASSEVCCPRCGLHFTPDARPAATDQRRQTVLVVEDLEYFIEIARDALSGKYEVKTARSVAEARAELVRGGIDLLLLDLALDGGEDGLALLREAPGKTCPVLLFTAQDESEMYGEGWARLQALGVDDVVLKGMNVGEMLTRQVATLLGEPLPQTGPIR
jgi:CheY-like chemotaxis protein